MFVVSFSCKFTKYNGSSARLEKIFFHFSPQGCYCICWKRLSEVLNIHTASIIKIPLLPREGLPNAKIVKKLIQTKGMSIKFISRPAKPAFSTFPRSIEKDFIPLIYKDMPHTFPLLAREDRPTGFPQDRGEAPSFFYSWQATPAARTSLPGTFHSASRAVCTRAPSAAVFIYLSAL